MLLWKCLKFRRVFQIVESARRFDTLQFQQYRASFPYYKCIIQASLTRDNLKISTLKLKIFSKHIYFFCFSRKKEIPSSRAAVGVSRDKAFVFLARRDHRKSSRRPVSGRVSLRRERSGLSLSGIKRVRIVRCDLIPYSIQGAFLPLSCEFRNAYTKDLLPLFFPTESLPGGRSGERKAGGDNSRDLM